MRLFLDECLPIRLAVALRKHGYDAVHVSDRDMLGAPDEAVLAVAADEKRVLVSADTDFGELLATGKATVPSVVLLRGAATTGRRLRMLVDNLGQVGDELEAGAIVVLGNGRVRVRRLPLT